MAGLGGLWRRGAVLPKGNQLGNGAQSDGGLWLDQTGLSCFWSFWTARPSYLLLEEKGSKGASQRDSRPRGRATRGSWENPARKRNPGRDTGHVTPTAPLHTFRSHVSNQLRGMRSASGMPRPGHCLGPCRDTLEAASLRYSWHDRWQGGPRLPWFRQDSVTQPHQPCFSKRDTGLASVTSACRAPGTVLQQLRALRSGGGWVGRGTPLRSLLALKLQGHADALWELGSKGGTPGPPCLAPGSTPKTTGCCPAPQPG